MIGILMTIGAGINTLAFVGTNYAFSKGGHGENVKENVKTT